jgi:hypothetical protein
MNVKTDAVMPVEQDDGSQRHALVEITKLRKSRGPLTKEIRLDGDKMVSDGAACIMPAGMAMRVPVGSLGEFADVLAGLDSSEAIALGALRSDLPNSVKVTTKRHLAQTEGAIARTRDYLDYCADRAGLALLDIDVKAMPAAVRDRVKRAGGLFAALASVLPALTRTGRVVRHSTSTGIWRTDTGDAIAGSGGLHIFPLVLDSSDVERFLRVMHDRCWLAGFGWMMIGAGGQFLRRSLIDASVYAPERLVFEGPPIMVPPLAQDQAGRRPTVLDGPPLDTRRCCDNLSIVETTLLERIQDDERRRLAPEAARARTSFLGSQAQRVVERTSCTLETARRAVARQCETGILLPGIILHFDDPDLGDVAVADILATPDRYIGETLSDPLEGEDYGSCKAMVMQRPDGSLWINSFAHGRTVYEIKHDAASVTAAIEAAGVTEAADVLARLTPVSDMDATQESTLRALASQRANVGLRAISQRIKAELHERASGLAAERRQRAEAMRNDRRIRLPAPAPDAPWLPQMQALNEVLGSVDEPEPPMRGIDGAIIQIRSRRIPNWHALTSGSANAEEPEDERLPPAEQPLLIRLDENGVAELIER